MYSNAKSEISATDVHVVAVSMGNQMQYWVAATPREEAVAAVEKLLAPGWSARLTDQRLTARKLAALRLRKNDVRVLIEAL
jgi:hypothetical protein